MSPYEFIQVLLLISISLLSNASVSSAQKDNHNSHKNSNNNNSFKPSKDLHGITRNSFNNTNPISTRYFQQNYNQFYNPSPNPNPFAKFNHFFYPSTQHHQSPPFFAPGNGNYQRQIRVPGIIEIRLQGRDAEITCEFQRYIILVQGIYWHHNIEPYGSYFDTRNGFAPHITVTNTDPWKSILTIKDYNEDDYGPYKCISTAILPDEGSFASFSYPEVRTNQLEESKRKVRFTRELKEQSNYNAAYDPFFSNYLGINLNGNVHNPVVPHHAYPHNLNTNNNYYPGGFNLINHHAHPGHHPQQHHQPSSGYFNPSGYNYNSNNNNWNVHAPYYKPSYSVSTIYQEVNFAPILPPPTTLSSPGK